MSELEAEHAVVVKLDRLEWLRDTMGLVYAREIAEPGYMTDGQGLGAA